MSLLCVHERTKRSKSQELDTTHNKDLTIQSKRLCADYEVGNSQAEFSGWNKKVQLC